jgi:hypothetical protein
MGLELNGSVVRNPHDDIPPARGYPPPDPSLKTVPTRGSIPVQDVGSYEKYETWRNQLGSTSFHGTIYRGEMASPLAEVKALKQAGEWIAQHHTKEALRIFATPAKDPDSDPQPER